MAVRQKSPRIQLDSGTYALLKNQVLERDNWRCQDCGSRGNLQVHHLRPRSKLGADIMTNLITLCAICHGKRHRR
jgi:5-methylcytosine-specific restriction endonuclease McrA